MADFGARCLQGKNSQRRNRLAVRRRHPDRKGKRRKNWLAAEKLKFGV